MRADLADSLQSISHRAPNIQHQDFQVFDVVLKSTALHALLRGIRNGHLPQGALAGVPAMKLAWAPTDKPAIDSFEDLISPKEYDLPFGSARSRVEINARPGSLSSWWQNNTDRRDFLRRLENRFETLGHGQLHQMGFRIGVLTFGTARFHENSSTMIKLVAPLPARIVQVTQDRAADALTVAVEVAKTYPQGRLSVRLVEQEGSYRSERRLRTGKRRLMRVTFRRLAPGAGYVLLCDSEHGIIGRRHGRIRSSSIPTRRAVAHYLMDPKFERVSEDLRSTKAEQHERAVALVLHLLGYSTSWWGRKMPMPKGVQTGRDAADIVATSRDDRGILVIECSTDWLGGDDDKIAKLVGRTNRVRRILHEATPDDIVDVQGVVAIGKERADAPDATVASLARHKVALLAADDLEDLLALLKAGVSDEELSSRFRQCLPTEVDFEQKVTSSDQAPFDDWS
jgi:hypothetical protein